MFKEFKIKDIGKVVTGKTPSSKKPEYFGKDYPFITPTDLSYDCRYPFIERYISDEGRSVLKNNLLPENTICFTSIGATIGKMCLTKELSFTNQQINSLIVDEKGFDYRYIYYVLKTKIPDFKVLAGGAATPIINKTTFSNFELYLTNLKTQQKIASVLSAYDKLIENNTRRIEILEEMAQRIYKKWFVDFKYPGHENDELVDSELGMIPEGWEVKSIVDNPYFRFIRNNVSEFNGSKTYFATADVQGTYFVKDGVEYQYHNKPSRAQKQPIVNSIWFARMKDSYKIAIYTRVNKKYAENSILSSGFAGFESEEEYYGYLYAIVSSKEFDTFKNLYATGATQVSLNNDGLKRILLPIPNENLIIKFSNTIKPLVDQSILLKSQSQNLKQTRDYLLPKLISGKVDVSDLDIDTGILDD